MRPTNTWPIRIAALLALAGTWTMLTGCPAPGTTQEPATDPANVRSGPYLGQPYPGNEPEVFAPGIVSTALYERDLTVTPDGRELYFSVVLGGYERSAIVTTRERPDGTWTEPHVAPFSGRYRDLEPALAPDGSRLYFVSYRPHDGKGEEREDTDLWVVDRSDDGWGTPVPLPAPVNSDLSEFFPTVTRDGTLYFTRDGEGGASALYRARPAADGGYAEPERLPEAVNSVAAQFNGWVDPDERFLVFGAFGRDDSRGGTDYYVSFRSEDDDWTGPVNLGDRINTKSGLEFSPSISPDGRWMFFMATRSRFESADFRLPETTAEIRELADGPRNGLPDIWWVDAAFLETLAPEKGDIPL